MKKARKPKPPRREGTPRFISDVRDTPPVSSRIVEVHFRASPWAGTAHDIKAANEPDDEPWFSDAGLQELLRNFDVEDHALSISPSDSDAEQESVKASPVDKIMAPGDGNAARRRLRNFVRYQFSTPEKASRAAEALRGRDMVESAKPVPTIVPANVPIPDDPLIKTLEWGWQTVPKEHFNAQWYLHRTNVPGAWELGARGAGVVVADIDFGCRSTHEELTQLEHTYWHKDSSDVSGGRDARHGTAVLGIVGAAANGHRICGYAPAASLWMIRGDAPPPPDDSRNPGHDPWANAILHACDREPDRPKVILVEAQTGEKKMRNIEQVESVAAAIRWAIDHGAVVCVAAGNGNAPAHRDDHDGLIKETGSILVGATTWHETMNPREKDSNFGPRVIVCAPGDRNLDVTCGDTADDDYTDQFGGTSGAAAKVAGTVALMLSMNPALKHADVREILVATGASLPPDPVAPEKTIGMFLNTAAAVKEAIRRRAEEPQPTPAEVVHLESGVLDEAA